MSSVFRLAYTCSECLYLFRKSHQKDAVTRKAEKVLRYKAKKSLEGTLQDLFSKMAVDDVDDDTLVSMVTHF